MDDHSLSQHAQRLALHYSGPDGIRQYEVLPPGATIGAWHGADIQLAIDDADIPLQAAIRYDSVRSHWAVIRLSQNGECRVDEVALSCGQVYPISGQASLHFSAKYQLTLQEDFGVPSQTIVTAEPPAESLSHLPVDAEDYHTAIDPFSDLLGAGAVPIGAAPTLDTRHPFAMESAAARNSPDPLRDLKPVPHLDIAEHVDPLERLNNVQRDPDACAPLTDGRLSVLGAAPNPEETGVKSAILESIGQAHDTIDATLQASTPAMSTTSSTSDTRADHRRVLNLPMRLRPSSRSARAAINQHRSTTSLDKPDTQD